LFSTLDKTTMALWPEVPTGGVPQRMSLACDQADELAALRAIVTATAVSARLSMAFSPAVSLVDGQSGHPSRPLSMPIVAAQLASATKAIDRPWRRLSSSVRAATE
jgi:hypothetical protein